MLESNIDKVLTTMRDLPDLSNEAEATNDHEVSIDQNKHQNHGGENNLTMNQTHADSTMQSKYQEANPSSSQSDDTYYEVETLLKMKFMKGKKHYLVRWKGNYSDTWEAEDFWYPGSGEGLDCIDS